MTDDPTTTRDEFVVMCSHDGPQHPWKPGEGCPDALAPGAWAVRPAPAAEADNAGEEPDCTCADESDCPWCPACTPRPAVSPGGQADEVREAIVAENRRHHFYWLQQHQTWVARCECRGWEERVVNTAWADDVLARWRLHAADALLSGPLAPLLAARQAVQRLIARGAADALNQAADDCVEHGNSWRQVLARNSAPFVYARWLRARAAALTPPTTEPEGQP